MATIDVPDLDQRPIDLTPRTVRAGQADGPPPGRVTLGGPFWASIPTGVREDDPETAAFRADPRFRWALGVMALSFELDEEADDIYERAWLEIALADPEGRAVDAVAWSMKPDSVSRERSLSTKVALTPSLKIADVGLESSVERGQEKKLSDVSIEAVAEMTSSPRWVFRRTPSEEIRGSTRLALVVRLPRDVSVAASIDLGVVSARRRAVFFWARTEHHRDRQVSPIDI